MQPVCPPPHVNVYLHSGNMDEEISNQVYVNWGFARFRKGNHEEMDSICRGVKPWEVSVSQKVVKLDESPPL